MVVVVLFQGYLKQCYVPPITNFFPPSPFLPPCPSSLPHTSLPLPIPPSPLPPSRVYNIFSLQTQLLYFSSALRRKGSSVFHHLFFPWTLTLTRFIYGLWRGPGVLVGVAWVFLWCWWWWSWGCDGVAPEVLVVVFLVCWWWCSWCAGGGVPGVLEVVLLEDMWWHHYGASVGPLE